MGLQKYRADKAGDKQKNGGTPYYSNCLGGPSLALIRNCPISNLICGTGKALLSPRTVYIQGEADTFFSIPAACAYKGQTIKGWIGTDVNGEYVFRLNAGQEDKLLCLAVSLRSAARRMTARIRQKKGGT